MRMQHLAIIPDGNRRWAQQNKLKSILGHKKGLEGFKTAVTFCLKKDIKYLSIYAFSLENFKRTEEEKHYLFDLFVSQARAVLKEFIEKEVRVRFLGNRAYFPERVIPLIAEMETKSEHCNKLYLNFLFCYGAKNEMVDAVKKMARAVKAGVLALDDINEDTISSSLWTAGMPDPDLIIRTSKRPRLSNFLLYQAAYSEFAFLDCYWPDITEAHFEQCFDTFKGVQRNFGT